MADGVLGEIVARKRTDVAVRLGGTSLESLRGQARRTARSLRAALSRPGARFVMEVKRGSPSAGLFAPVDPAAQAGVYAGVADAISVLTDGPYFGGSLADLAAVRAGFDGPLLAKDFVIDQRQVVEARLHGADAVLVMLSVLEDDAARTMLDEAELLGMDVLVEAHDESELRRAVALGAPLIGINNRDLKTLKVDLSVTERLASLVPADRVVVAESGITGRADVERLAPYADAFLVGTALMRAGDPAEAARALAFGRVKLCGITRAGDLDLAAAAGATHAGFVLVPGTPRAVTVGEAAAILADAYADADPSATPKRVGIFRDASPEQVAEAASRLGLAAVQLHGREMVADYRRILPETVELWVAEAVGEDTGPRRDADRTLFDTGAGGSGRTFDWGRVAARPELADGLLAGGLNPANAAAASRMGAWALDVGSGLEAAPGRKDPAKVAAFFEALRPVARRERAAC